MEQEIKSRAFYTKVSNETYEEIQLLGVKFNHIVELGLRAYKDNPQLIKRIRDLELDMERVNDRLARHSDRIYALEK